MVMVRGEADVVGCDSGAVGDWGAWEADVEERWDWDGEVGA